MVKIGKDIPDEMDDSNKRVINAQDDNSKVIPKARPKPEAYPIPADALRWFVKSMKERMQHHLPKCSCGAKRDYIVDKNPTVPEYLDLRCRACNMVTVWSPSPTWGYIIQIEDFIKKMVGG